MPQVTQQGKGRVAVGSLGLLPNVGLCSLSCGAPGMVDKPGSEHEAYLSHLGLVPCPLRPPFPCLPTGERAANPANLPGAGPNGEGMGRYPME